MPWKEFSFWVEVLIGKKPVETWWKRRSLLATFKNSSLLFSSIYDFQNEWIISHIKKIVQVPSNSLSEWEFEWVSKCFLSFWNWWKKIFLAWPHFWITVMHIIQKTILIKILGEQIFFENFNFSNLLSKVTPTKIKKSFEGSFFLAKVLILLAVHHCAP